MTEQPHWYILGAGAIGCLWASDWRQHHYDVTLITKPQRHTEAVTRCDDQGQHRYTVACTTAERIQQPIDYLLVTTKAHQTRQALATVRSYLSDTATLLVLQNGVVATTLAVSASQRLFAASTTDGAYCTEPFQVTYAGRGETYLGALTNCTPTATTALLSQLPPGLAIKACDNIEERLWRKFAINCAINGLTVKYNGRNGELLNNPQAYRELSALCREVADIASVLKPADWFTDLQQQVETVLRGTANNINSMLQDVRAHRITEIASLNAYLCEQAQALDLPCPLNQALVELVESHGLGDHRE